MDLDSFTSVLLDTIERSFSRNSLEYHKELLEEQQENFQRSLPLEEAVWIGRQAGTVETKVWADASTQLIEKQQIDSFLQADKHYGNKLWLYGQRNGLNDYTSNKFWLYGQRTELHDYISKKSQNGDFKLEKMTLRRERVFQKHQPQINILKIFKNKIGGNVAGINKAEGLEKIQKEEKNRRLSFCFFFLLGKEDSSKLKS